MSGPGWTVGPFPGESAWLRVEEASAVAAARRRVTALAGPLGFSEERLAQLGLAASEAASNLYKHAHGGVLGFRVARADGIASIELICVDAGPGMADVPRSMRDGYSTAGTLGIGLGAIARLADHSDVHSVPDRGSVLTAAFTADGGPGERAAPDAPDAPGAPGAPNLPHAEPRFAGLTQAMAGQDACGDGYAFHMDDDGNVLAMLCDGLGHGPLAAAATGQAIQSLREADPAAGPADLLRKVHRGLRHTRGGAVAIAAVDAARGVVRYAGLGNIAGWVSGPEGRRGMVSTPGIAGHQARAFREHVHQLPRDGSVVMHSDGLSDRWRPADYPGLFARRPLLISATLLRDAGVRNDDRCVIVIKAA